MSPKAWHERLERWLAEEPIGALAAEYGVRRPTIHRNACVLEMRNKDRPDAVRLAKGPAQGGGDPGPAADGAEAGRAAEAAGDDDAPADAGADRLAGRGELRDQPCDAGGACGASVAGFLEELTARYGGTRSASGRGPSRWRPCTNRAG